MYKVLGLDEAKMQLADLWRRALPPVPWHEADNIPWNDPGFSARMLEEHLSQAHDAASRREVLIDRHVAWIHQALLHERPAKILDLGCGPGLYTSCLARLGHACTGIDFGPSAIEYARATAAAEGLDCRYQLEDLRAAEFGESYGMAMCIFGELNVFPREQAAKLLSKACDALNHGGVLLLEAHTFAAIQQIGQADPRWFTAASGLYGAEPHLCLIEHFWHAESRAATSRYYVAELATGALTRYAQSFQAYTEAEYTELLRSCGFGEISFAPALSGAAEPDRDDLLVIIARKPGEATRASAAEHNNG